MDDRPTRTFPFDSTTTLKSRRCWPQQTSKQSKPSLTGTRIHLVVSRRRLSSLPVKQAMSNDRIGVARNEVIHQLHCEPALHRPCTKRNRMSSNRCPQSPCLETDA